MKRTYYQQYILILLTVLFLSAATFLSIFVAGLAQVFVLFPGLFIIIVISVISFRKGFKTRDKQKNWYIFGIIILSLGVLALWSPFYKYTRSVIERKWRWEARNHVVEAVISGELKPYTGIDIEKTNDGVIYYVVVPFEKFGRVSFRAVKEEENSIEVQITPETGYRIIFITNSVFGGSDSELIYIQKTGKNNYSSKNRIDGHWYWN